MLARRWLDGVICRAMVGATSSCWLSVVRCVSFLSCRPVLSPSSFQFCLRLSSRHFLSYFFYTANSLMCWHAYHCFFPRAHRGPRIILALLMLLSPSLPEVTQTRVPPHYGTRFQFYRENNSALSSLVDSRRIVPTRAARRFQQLITIQVKFHHGGMQTQGPTLLVFEGNH